MVGEKEMSLDDNDIEMSPMNGDKVKGLFVEI